MVVVPGRHNVQFVYYTVYCVGIGVCNDSGQVCVCLRMFAHVERRLNEWHVQCIGCLNTLAAGTLEE